MRFLTDAHLPPRLCRFLSEKAGHCTHISETEGGLTSTDTAVWQLAQATGAIVVSKDGDFVERAVVLGPPPQVLHIGVGNCSNSDLFALLEDLWPEIEKHLRVGVRLVSVNREGLEILE